MNLCLWFLVRLVRSKTVSQFLCMPATTTPHKVVECQTQLETDLAIQTVYSMLARWRWTVHWVISWTEFLWYTLFWVASYMSLLLTFDVFWVLLSSFGAFLAWSPSCVFWCLLAFFGVFWVFVRTGPQRTATEADWGTTEWTIAQICTRLSATATQFSGDLIGWFRQHTFEWTCLDLRVGFVFLQRFSLN